MSEEFLVENTEPIKGSDGWECPDCSETFKTKFALTRHKQNVHESPKPKASTKKPAEPRISKAVADRKSKVAFMLREIADVMDDVRGKTGTSQLPEQLSDVIRRDADQLATVISWAAAKADPVKWFVDNILGIISPTLASSGILRWIFRDWKRRLEARQEANFLGGEEVIIVEPPPANDPSQYRGIADVSPEG